MKVPLSWLTSFVDPGVPVDELAHRLTMAGLEVEKIERIGAEWDRVFVGYVHAVDPHPDADRLVLADVEAGAHRLTVVTGAPNIAAGQKVALALAGANLIDGYSDSGARKVLKPSKVRGVLSEGMVCSEKELGLSEEHEGIMVLEDTAPVGLALEDYLGDTVLEFEITPNLVHNFSVLGVAREVSALYDYPVSMPEITALDRLPAGAPDLVTIVDDDLSSRYMGIVFKGVRVEPSPAWLARRLTNAGVRPINNIVDITNYVMLEFGQPLHAFDRALLREGRIVVRRARPGETIETLDHQQRELTEETLVIADAERAVAIAGLMGGVDSEVSDTTIEILLEGANFDMKSVRHTSRRLKLRTEASARFERGIDPNLVEEAMARATALILDICQGSRVTAASDVYPHPVFPRELTMRYSRVARVLGVDIPREQAAAVLSRLQLQPRFSGEDGSQLNLTVPTWRQDITLADDVVEEIARVVGYETLPSTLPLGQAVPVQRDPVFRLQGEIRSIAIAAGLSEAVTYVTNSEEMLDRFRAAERKSAGLLVDMPAGGMLRIVNPLQSDRRLLRVSMLPTLLESAEANLKHTPNVRLFEFGRLFVPLGAGSLPHELEAMAIVMAGTRDALSSYAHPGEIDFFDVKGVVQAVLDRSGACDVAYEPASDPAFHPGRTAKAVSQGRTLGVFGELLPAAAASFGIDGVRVCAAEISLEAMLESPDDTRREVRTQRYLPARQDFAIVVEESTPAGAVEAALRAGAGPLVTAVELFDVYRGEQLGQNRKSLAYRVTFTAPDRTLTDDDLVKVRKRIEKTLTQQVGGVLRA
jgi:phenylalanyl-tRNA synthetase beta chain